jgi:hypothetical protein
MFGEKKPAHPRRSVQDNQYESVLKNSPINTSGILIVGFLPLPHQR